MGLSSGQVLPWATGVIRAANSSAPIRARVAAGLDGEDECVMVIPVAEKVLIVGRVLNLAYGAPLGYQRQQGDRLGTGRRLHAELTQDRRAAGIAKVALITAHRPI